MPITLLASAKGVENTTAIDTTGANFLLAAHNPGLGGSFTDSKANSWTDLNLAQENTTPVYSRMAYSLPTTVGTTHTLGARIWYGTAIFGAFAGVSSSPVFTQNTAIRDTVGTTLALPTVTPTEDGCLVLTHISFSGAVTGLTPPSGFTLLQDIQTSAPSAVAYKIQTTATAETCTWSWTGSVKAAAEIVVIRPDGGGVTAPNPPTIGATTNITGTTATFNWTDNSTNETSFLVQVESPNGAGNWTNASGATNPTAANVTSFNATGLTLSSTYRVRVRASNSGGDSAWSTGGDFTAGGGGGDTTPPSITTLNATGGINSVSATFNSNEAGTFYYKLSASATPESIPTPPSAVTGYTSVAMVSGTNSLNISGVSAGSYYLHIAAQDTIPNRTANSIVSGQFVVTNPAVNGTITLPGWVNNTGLPHPPGTLVNISFHNTSTRALVLYSANAALNSSSALIITNASLVPGVEYEWLAESPSDNTVFAAGRVVAT